MFVCANDGREQSCWKGTAAAAAAAPAAASAPARVHVYLQLHTENTL